MAEISSAEAVPHVSHSDRRKFRRNTAREQIGSLIRKAARFFVWHREFLYLEVDEVIGFEVEERNGTEWVIVRARVPLSKIQRVEERTTM